MSSFSLPAPSRPRRAARWIALLAASVLWHVFLFNWADGHIVLPSLRTEQPEVVTAELRPPPAPAAPKKPAAAPQKRKPKPRMPPPSPPPSSSPEPAPASTAVPALADVMGADADEAPLAAFPEADPQPQFAEPSQPDMNAADNFKFDPPPSADLAYDVHALREGKQWYGKGAFSWNTNAGSYSITGEASVSFLIKITVLNFHSEGAINGFGIAPVLYREKPWRKSETNTHFQHENRKISFSASEAVFPYNGGEQDRASVIWQLAGIGRGDPSQFAPGAAFGIVVAGVRNADAWRVEVAGQEEIDTPYGKLNAWHLVRVPQAGSHDQKLDIWLAPQQDWYPARVRFTYSNGEYLDMQLSQLTRHSPVVTSAGQE
ncbi:DUF3108 domain-containing protein [Herbaspirillum sp. HC18]|nr:DUF3108 domain-containing protein [Herbaspirillum sp. HC18]